MPEQPLLFVENCDYQSFPIGGQHSFIRTLLAYVEKDVRLAGVATKREEPLFVWTRKKVAGRERPFFAFRYIRPASGMPLIPRRIHFLVQVLRAKKRLLEFRPAVVYAQSVEAALPFLVGRQTVPVVFRLAGANNPLSFSRFSWGRFALFQKLYELFFLRPVIRRSHSIIAINEDCEKLCIRLRKGLNQNWRRLPLGVNQQVFYPQERDEARHRLQIDAKGKILICVGRLSQVKGYNLAFAVLERLKEDQDIRLFLVGDGEDRATLEAEVRRRDLDKQVTFWGAVAHDRLPMLLNAADVFFMPSLAEGLPNALLEAMACGLPVVASPVGGIPDVIRSGENGFLLSDRDSDNAAKMVLAALDAPQALRLSALRTIEERYSVATLARLIDKLFLQAARPASTADVPRDKLC